MPASPKTCQHCVRRTVCAATDHGWVLSYVPAGRLWVNPDCGLKTRGYPESEASLRHLVAAAAELR